LLPEVLSPLYGISWNIRPGFTYSKSIGAINTALAKTISEDADFEQALETAMADMPIPVIPTPDEAPIVVATPRAPLPEGVTAIKYYFIQYNPNELTAMKTLVEQYNQNSSDSRIELLTEFYGNPGEDWVASIASNFDCFTSSAPYGPDFNPEPLLKLNSFLSGEPASFASDFSDEMLAKFSVDGNLYAIPASSQVQMIAYNADLLARRGLEIPDNDWTFNDFMEMAMAVSSTDDADPSYGYMFSPYDEFITRGKDVEWADLISNPPEVYLDSPEMQEHLEWLAEMESENVLLDQESDWEKTQNIMISGQLAWSAMMGDEASWFYGMGRTRPSRSAWLLTQKLTAAYRR
jgi:ABC-type glycerol-3-phosphate transport system substrate-binding protein